MAGGADHEGLPAHGGHEVGSAGLRPSRPGEVGEVAWLRLDSVDWRHGELLIRGKGGRQDVLPLPIGMVEALMACLRRRPRCQCRALFFRVTAPRQEWTAARSGGSSVRRATVRAYRGLARIACGTRPRPDAMARSCIKCNIPGPA
jgi:hypothetical protein